MDFQDRVPAQGMTGKKKLVKVDAGNVPTGDPDIYVNIVHDDDATNPGTEINAENLNKGNWRDDKSVSFMKLDNNTLPNAKAGETQIVTKSDGTTWIVPPAGAGNAAISIDQIMATANQALQVAETAQISANGGTVVEVNNTPVTTLNFNSDPQSQINSITSNMATMADIQTAITGWLGGSS